VILPNASKARRDIYAIRIAVMVLSFELPVALKRILPLALALSLQLILRFPTGPVITPESDIDTTRTFDCRLQRALGLLLVATGVMLLSHVPLSHASFWASVLNHFGGDPNAPGEGGSFRSLKRLGLRRVRPVVSALMSGVRGRGIKRSFVMKWIENGYGGTKCSRAYAGTIR
jgi:hypothetical protein